MELNYADLFDRAARLLAGRAALIDDTGSLGYSELSGMADRLANALLAQDFPKSTPFAILSPNANLALAAMIGGIKAGGAWSNINLRNALATNIDILKRGGCQVLFFHSSTIAQIEEIRHGVATLRILVCIDREIEAYPSLAAFCRDADDRNTSVHMDATDVQFQGSTGGTTGAPKITQGGPAFLAQAAIAFRTEMHFDRVPVNLAVAPITHAAGIVALSTLAMGGTVVLMAHADLGEILRNIEKHSVSMLFLPPTLIYMLMNHPDAKRTDFSSLRYLMSAAAPFAVEKIAAAHALFGPCVCQCYGQTESGMPLTFMSPEHMTEALANPEHAGRLRSAGLPTAIVSGFEVMDENGGLLPPGKVGELVVRGPTIMLRYIGDPDATTAVKQYGWQHTGDVGYRDTDGFIYISDRKRDLIISGGFNVFPLEIEQVLTRHPAVQDCAVIGVPDEKWGEAVKAIVELAPGKSADEAELIALCKEALGSVMAPKSIEFIKELPRSPVGKVLKRELREPYWKDHSARI
jgi:acyl-CoA synthetase (AMP-forming)/AMP-acid ligase II